MKTVGPFLFVEGLDCVGDEDSKFVDNGIIRRQNIYLRRADLEQLRWLPQSVPSKGPGRVLKIKVAAGCRNNSTFALIQWVTPCAEA